MTLSRQGRANVMLALLFLVFGIVYFFPPQDNRFYPLCPFYAFTHLLCPGCGGTRALYQILHLHFAEAMRLNALVTISAPIVLAWFFYWYYSVVRYDRSPRIRLPRLVVAALYAVVLLFAVTRNLHQFVL